MHIRPATDTDLPAILALLARVIPHLHAQGNHQWDSTYPNADILGQDIARNELYVAEHESTIAGFVMITTQPEHAYHHAGLDPSTPAVTTHRLAVDPNLRGQGIGIALLQHAERVAHRLGITRLRLDTAAENTVSQTLFARLGYSFTGKIDLDYRPGLRVLVFEKTLRSPALPNPVFAALTTNHPHFASTLGHAIRYRAEYITFAGLASLTSAAFADLRELLAPGESIFLTTENEEQLPPDTAGLEQTHVIPGVQMLYLGPRVSTTSEDCGVVRLTTANAAEMLALKAVAFPGFVGPRFMELGSFFGVRDERGQLVAMAGERFASGPLAEVSAVCTHPDHRGQGLASRLMLAVMGEQTRRGQQTFLHTGADNTNAIALYHRLGFEITAKMQFHQVRREG